MAPRRNITGDNVNDGKTVICYSPSMVTTNGIWDGDNLFDFSLPLFILQIVIVVVTTRILVFLLKPLRQPRVVAEIFAGVVLGPSVLGRISSFGVSMFPGRSLLTLETVAHLGLLYFLFLVGVEMDVAVIRRTGKKAIVIAVVGMALPFAIGTGTSFVFRNHVSTNIHQLAFLLFLGVALSITAFPVLARILAETKLLNSDLGRLAMSTAIINDMCAWVLLAFSIAIAETRGSALPSLWVLITGAIFVAFCFYVVRPMTWWLSERIQDGKGVTDFHICLVLTGVMLAAIATDAIGIHAVFGAFVYGLVIPNGPLGVMLIEKLEDFVTGLLLPLFFVISGLRTDVTKISDPVTAWLLVLVFVLASLGKIVGTILIAAFYSVPFREGFALGFLMNTRGLVEMIVLNIGRDKEVLDDESFAIMVLVSVGMTALVTPVVIGVHRPARRLMGYKRRNIQRSKPDGELRVLTCIHTGRNVPSLISLLDLANPTKRSPIVVYALQLVELTGRASNMLVINSSAKDSAHHHRRSRRRRRLGHQNENFFSAFENYEQHAGGISVQTHTAVSPYQTMHEDVCAIAADKHATLILLPFHKQQAVDGGMEPINPAIRTLNERILAAAPCSVAILVDRGLGAAASRGAARNAALLFFGGPDDREALAYAWRMVDHPSVSLTVVRFFPLDLDCSSSPKSAPTAGAAKNPRSITIVTDSTHERLLDDEYINEFRTRNAGNGSVTYTEKAVGNSEETVAAIRSMEFIHDLYIVGRSQGSAGSSLTAGMTEWTECPELGPIGDLLASSDFAMMVSVMVVQQYVSVAAAPGDGMSAMIDSPGQQAAQQYLSNANQRMPTVAFNNVCWSRR